MQCPKCGCTMFLEGNLWWCWSCESYEIPFTKHTPKWEKTAFVIFSIAILASYAVIGVYLFWQQF